MVNKIAPTLPMADTERSKDIQRKRLLESSKEFEAVLTGNLLKTMRASTMRGDEPDSARGLYEEMMDNVLAKELSNTGSMGIGDMLFSHLEQLAFNKPDPSAGNGNGEGQPE
jgi:Rod binding domain-containing protein